MAAPAPILLAHFWSKVAVKGNGDCWLWQGATQNGYGKFREAQAHRFAFEAAKGAIPNKLIVRHLCGNKACVNPHHLDVGTPQDNADDGLRLGERRVGHTNGRAVLTADQVRMIRDNPNGEQGKILALRFGVSPATVSLIRSGRRWASC